MLKQIGAFALIGAAHIIIGVFFYYARIRGLGSAFRSDVVVFLLPAVAAFSGYFFVVERAMPPRFPLLVRILLAALLSVGAVAVSFNLIAFIAFNRWGT